MHPKRTTIPCDRCGRALPRDAFQHIERTDRPGKFRLDQVCLECRPIRDAEREARRRVPNLTVLCACGCGKPTNLAPTTDARFGWVAGHPMRYLLGHNARKTPYPETEYVVDPVTGCWNWQFAIDEDGYGKLTRNGKDHRAHRYFYEEKNGPLPEGYVPDHCCPGGPNRACVNPDHMRPLTHEDNSRYKLSTKLSPEAAAGIRALEGTMLQREIGDLYGISQAHVSSILAGDHWPE